MQKVVLFSLIFIICTGCTATRITKSLSGGGFSKVSLDKTTKNLRAQNLTNQGFIIQKAVIQVNGKNMSEKFLGSIKYLCPGRYLISLRTNAGIEVTRIYISNDTLIINDRINRKQYAGTDSYVKNKFGFSFGILPVVFGDVVGENLDDNIMNCINGKYELTGFVEEKAIKYIIDCDKMKCISANLTETEGSDGIILSYSDFMRNDGKKIPGKIRIENLERDMSLIIEIKKFLYPWNGSIEFVSGINYEKVLLK